MRTELATHSAGFHRQFLPDVVLMLMMYALGALLSLALIPVAKFMSPNESVRPAAAQQ